MKTIRLNIAQAIKYEMYNVGDRVAFNTGKTVNPGRWQLGTVRSVDPKVQNVLAYKLDDGTEGNGDFHATDLAQRIVSVPKTVKPSKESLRFVDVLDLKYGKPSANAFLKNLNSSLRASIEKEMSADQSILAAHAAGVKVLRTLYAEGEKQSPSRGTLANVREVKMVIGFLGEIERALTPFGVISPDYPQNYRQYLVERKSKQGT